MKDLAPVSLIGTSPQVLIVNGKLPIKTLQEFVACVKPNPKKLAYAGGGGPGSVSNLLMALFLKRAGLEMNAVSYRGTAPALTDIIGGHVPAMFIPLPEALPHAATGAVRMLALSDDRRAPAGEGRPDHRGVRLPGFPRRELERHDGAGGDAAGDHRSHRRSSSSRPRRIRSSSRSSTSTARCRSATRPRSSRKFLQEDMALWAEAVKIAGVTLDSQ